LVSLISLDESAMTLKPAHFPEEDRNILRAVALAYRRVKRAPLEPAMTRGETSRRDQQRESDALAAATAEYRRLDPSAPDDPLAVSGEVNQMIAAVINADPRWFRHGPDA
jgi:hypothetical protein